jgi:hypothetical protein
MHKKKTDKMGLMAEKALKEAVVKALEKHKRMGVPAVFMKDGKMVYLMPDGKVVERIKDWKNIKGIKPLKFR